MKNDFPQNHPYVQIVLNSANGNPLTLDNPLEDVDCSNYSVSVCLLSKRDQLITDARIAAYRLIACDQFVLDTRYDISTVCEDPVTCPLSISRVNLEKNIVFYSDGNIVCFNISLQQIEDFRLMISIHLHGKSTTDQFTTVHQNPVVATYQSFYTAKQLLNSSTGTLNGVLLSETKEIVGNISLDYLYCKPWPNSHLWQENPFISLQELSRPLMIGHRGSGSSFTNSPSKFLENTIGSFMAAGDSGADFIELDVQLTRDHAVVVFHDFLTETIVDKNLAISDMNSRFGIPLRDLSHHQLKKNKFKHASLASHRDTVHRDTFSDNSSDDGTLFPLLGEVISHLPPNLGIDVEVKFPLQDRNGECDLEGSYFDRSLVVDRVLDEVFANNSVHKRRIVFSSFDPGICIMLRRKQHHYPVLFLVHGPLSMDKFKTKDSLPVNTAIVFAICEKLHGICADIEPIIENLGEVIDVVHKNGLNLFTWGNLNNYIDNISKQVEIGVDGIIFDRIYDLLPMHISNSHKASPCPSSPSKTLSIE